MLKVDEIISHVILVITFNTTNNGGIKMSSIEHQKAVAKEVLNRLKTVDIFTMLAGGACRDWYLNTEASDLDFYVHYSDKYPQWALCETFSKLLGVKMKIVGKKGEKLNKNSDVAYTKDPNISFVLGGSIDGVEVQVIIVNKPFFNVSNFCFDICQAYSLDIDNIQTTSLFDRAVKHKTIQITGGFYSQKDAYTKKIKEKFPDYLHIGF